MRILIRTFFRALRAVLTPILLLGDKLTTPKSMERDPAEQAKVDAETRHLALYQFVACPFCVKTRRAIKRLGLNIELRDAQLDTEHRQALLEGGGKIQVPCLRIEHPDGRVEWMYESSDIIQYLEERFGNPGAAVTR
ncbi:glutaredoxin family protein [Thioalkalivibrio nitratireducens]|nr:glutathione S-transferase N-terminal domain-containing protein [Thioalkalivibrio nitratireducens]